jgi:hypothetical protein
MGKGEGMTLEQRVRGDCLQVLRENASPDFIAANPELFGNRLATKSSSKCMESMPISGKSEAEFQKELIKKLQGIGWLVCEFRKARVMKNRKDVYRTPFGADGEGFPDLVAVKPPQVLFIENKSENGTASPVQIRWLLALGKCPGVEVHVLKPSDTEKINEILRRE